MSTILIGVDESTRSKDAVAFARRLAGAASGHVVVACAFPYNDMAGRSANLAYREALKGDAARTARRMSRLLELPEERTSIAVIADTSVPRALHELAEREQAAMVVVGHTHSGRAGRIVPEGFRERPEAAARRVGVAYMDTPEGRAALAAAVPLARALGARLEVIGVVSEDLYEAPAMMGARGASTLREDVGRHVQAELESVAKDLRSEVWAEAVKLEGDPAQELAEHSKELDLLVMGSRGYGPLRAVLAGGVSGRVTREAHCPVIVVPRGVDAPLDELFGTAIAAPVNAGA